MAELAWDVTADCNVLIMFVMAITAVMAIMAVIPVIAIMTNGHYDLDDLASSHMSFSIFDVLVINSVINLVIIAKMAIQL